MKSTFDIDIKPLVLRGNPSLKTIYYDATCILCNNSIQIIKKFDRGNNFEFIPLQFSGKFIKGDNCSGFESIILREKNQIFQKSDAVFRIIKYLKSPVSWLYVFIVIPKVLRDWIYDFIAKNRFKWFGRNGTCEV